MDYQLQQLVILSTIVFLAKFSVCVELTFELPDNAKECFYQDIKKNQSATLEFQVHYYFITFVLLGQIIVDVAIVDLCLLHIKYNYCNQLVKMANIFGRN